MVEGSLAAPAHMLREQPWQLWRPSGAGQPVCSAETCINQFLTRQTITVKDPNKNLLTKTPGLVLCASSCELRMTQTHQELLSKRNHLCNAVCILQVQIKSQQHLCKGIGRVEMQGGGPQLIQVRQVFICNCVVEEQGSKHCGCRDERRWRGWVCRAVQMAVNLENAKWVVTSFFITAVKQA